MAFKAFWESSSTRDLVVVDLGYSAHNSSCGVYWTGAAEPEEVQFGDSITTTAERIAQLKDPVLVLEAALSTYHAPSGNPDIRGAFEQGRGWYWGVGVLSFAAGLRFLQVLNQKKEVRGRDIAVAEAFLPHRNRRTGHAKDAVFIHNYFWDRHPVAMKENVRAASHLIQRAPSVRDFNTVVG